MLNLKRLQLEVNIHNRTLCINRTSCIQYVQIFYNNPCSVFMLMLLFIPFRSTLKHLVSM